MSKRDSQSNNLTLRDRSRLKEDELGERAMPLFNVTFQISSSYADESLNISSTAKKIHEAADLDSLFDILDNTDELETIDDTCAINPDIDKGPDEINIEYVLIHDESDIEIYRDADFSD